MQTGNETYIKEYHLEPFEVNVLSKEQTLLEKMVSLVRCSFEENMVAGLKGKIRHFYDLYFLMKDAECAAFIGSDGFKQQFDVILQHDKVIFEEPKGWQKKLLSESALVNDFENIWKQIKDKYQTELSALAYRPIPSEAVVAKHFSELINLIK